MKHYYQNKDPFTGKTNTFLYQDISNTFAPYGMSTEVFFDAIVTREDFLHGTYKLIEVDAAGNIISTVMLDPKIYQEDFTPSGRDIHFNPEQNSKSSFLISNVYGDKQRYLVEVEYQSYGIAFGGKAACLCLHDDLLGRISFRQLNKEESFTHKVCNGQYYSPLAYPAFYAKFKNKFGGTLEAPKLPNLIGTFPRNIGTSSNPFSGYFNIDNPGTPYIQRIPKIKWMNTRLPDHNHEVPITIKATTSVSGGANGPRAHLINQTTSTIWTEVYLNSWNSIRTNTNVDLNNYEFTDRFEPKCIDVIPFIRMV